MPDLDSLLNFLYIVAFLAAMILPSFQRQRREEARKRAETQRQAQDVPTVEERSPEDVPEPTIRRSAPTEAAAPAAAPSAAPTSVAPEPTMRSSAPAEAAAAKEPAVAMEPAGAAAAAQVVGATDLTDLDETIDLTALDDELDVTSIDDAAQPSRKSPVALDELARAEGAPPRIPAGDRAALRQALIFGELLQKPLALRRERSFPP